MIRAILFDLDDTLFDHAHSARAALAVAAGKWAALDALGPDELLERYQTILRDTHPDRLAGRISPADSRKDRMRRLLATVRLDGSAADIEEVLAAQQPAYRAARRAAPGALAVLAELRRLGVKTAVVTNNFVGEQMEKLDACGFTPLIDVTAISEEVGATKPNPRIFHVALERLGVGATAARMVGDSWDNDVLGALAAGIRPFWFDSTSAKAPDPTVEKLGSFEPHLEVAAKLLAE